MRLPRKGSSGAKWAGLRRLSQMFFLALFLWLLFRTDFRGTANGRLLHPVNWFLRADPLVAAVRALSTGALYRGLLWSLAIVIPTLFLGRFFCGWICPLGTLNHFFSSLPADSKRGKRRIESNRYARWQKTKYYVLFAVLAAALLGTGIAGLLDPIALAVRSLAISVLPAANGVLHGFGDARQPHFRQGFLLGLLFVAILASNLRVTRFWCRALCPLGALLGILSRWSILGLEKRAGQCSDCNRCLLHCQGGDDPIPGQPWRKAECILCFNCVSDCPESGLQFRFFPGRSDARETPDLRRRHALVGLAAGAAAVPFLRTPAGYAVERHERLLRPPGAVDEPGFLARCIRCAECMKVCPTHALQPSLAEAGVEGLWTPVLAPRIGYCEPSCTLCGQICPTGAIREFTAVEKASIRIGTAFYDRGRCLPWAMATECIVCEEWCPTSPKAVYLREADVTDAAGNIRRVRQPYIDPAQCIGCGACEYACPIADRPAVYVTSIGESRSGTNQMLLAGARPAKVTLPEPGEAQGWTKTGATRTFAAADLWQYMDGGADRYRQAGVEQTFTAPYRYRDGVEANVEVHLFRTPAGPQAILEAEPAAGSRAADLGDAARLYAASLVFRRRRCLVRIVAYQEGAGVGPALVALGRAIDVRLP
ncbi:MAG TPA: DUF6599 family protein [Bryobacteraceae bacterium]|nr:DUF6599 family protein [Bryobacteraceae bacterium]